MSRRVVHLTGDVWERLDVPCRGCLFWQFGEPGPAERDDDGAEAARVRKQAWTTALLHAGTPAGRAVLVDGQPVGFVEFAPAGELATRRPPVPPTDHDALVLTTMWVDPAHRTNGIGRLLVREAVRAAIERGHGEVQAHADRRWRPDTCLLPITWLLHEGFQVAREHPRYPLLHLEVARTVRWADSLEQAVEEVRDRLPRRATAPRPAVESRGRIDTR
ncbi:GNAT family N-acetyltransferase [Salsipaludibacter albus]|uniref:GNAT family N-acetyltransferase n=1 Tax=Salsipaludibacter albus TaxID=2849650 RepID=UPI001EE4393B|nr:GNAT family N-acetyltransferase [Salsipaludibacter albus]MBY5161241.1 GNAT family N-acetyltransferase [Salsipaludibacter albus]